jgi:hypothetical protein
MASTSLRSAALSSGIIFAAITITAGVVLK